MQSRQPLRTARSLLQWRRRDANPDKIRKETPSHIIVSVIEWRIRFQFKLLFLFLPTSILANIHFTSSMVP